ncbi:hypothetical protein NUU61_008109 [Penicillium alfredii]|uniref:U1 small nuclear ribonucleoprotein C n=1 Tax=Penicillium alfredii TaxID=1506179 RepID=A0A9W9ERT4_9EURO|nr:uncharacterized protein NUU61_008109 [Penicillium alfredii]KAJ5086802.1 hypothetical protein NUU61_008109 [Penicillium alfredii]
MGLGVYRGEHATTPPFNAELIIEIVYLSPLTKYSGPKLAALTTLYQAYYDIYHTGQFFKKLDKLHQEYGQIVRINPHEIHVNDPDFADVLFTGNSQRRDKYKWLERSILQNFNGDRFAAVDAMFGLAWTLMNMLPLSIMGLLYPGLILIEEIWASKENADGADAMMFHGILNSDLPPEEKTTYRLRQEAQMVILADSRGTRQQSSGVGSPAKTHDKKSTIAAACTLSAITYELLANPDKLKKLKAELAAALPDPNSVPSLATIEKLPSLNAVIAECLQVHPGAGLYDPRGSGQHHGVPRQGCWFNLAYAELYIVLAGIFRKYDLDDGSGKQIGPTLALYDTTRERDVDAVIDLLVPFPAEGSKKLANPSFKQTPSCREWLLSSTVAIFCHPTPPQPAPWQLSDQSDSAYPFNALPGYQAHCPECLAEITSSTETKVPRKRLLSNSSPEPEFSFFARQQKLTFYVLFCDYCDVYLTHDSMSVRKAHNAGRNHLRNVVEYYQQIGQEKAQSVIDSITSSYAAEGQPLPNPAMVPPGAFPPPFGFPGRPGQVPPPPFGIPPPGAPGAPGLPPHTLFFNSPRRPRSPIHAALPQCLRNPAHGRFPPAPPQHAPRRRSLPPPPGGLPPNFPVPPPGAGAFPPPPMPGQPGISPSPGPGPGAPPGASNSPVPTGPRASEGYGPPPGRGDRW